MATFRERIRAAVDVFQKGYPWEQAGRGGANLARKAAPFMIWPAYWRDNPQWQAVDLQSYIDEGFDVNTLIYSAVMVKGRAAIQAPLRAYEGEEEDARFLETEHPLSRLVYRPNPSQSWREFQLTQTISLNIMGDALTWFNRKNEDLGVPGEMYPLNRMRTYIIPGDKGKIKGYWYVPQGVAMADGYPLLVEDVSHVKLPRPDDELDGEGFGLSPITPLAKSGDVDNMITRFLFLFFQRGAAPVGTLQFDRPLDDDTVGIIKERWREMYGGYENWTDIGVLDSGGEYQRIGMTFEELGFEALDERNESRILGPFGVPPILVGSRLGLMRSTYANYKEAREGFWEDTMTPEMLLHEDDYRFYLRSTDGGMVGFDFAKVPALRKDVSTQVDAWATLVQNGVSKHRAARVVGLNLGKLPDGDINYPPAQSAPVLKSSSLRSELHDADGRTRRSAPTVQTDGGEGDGRTDRSGRTHLGRTRRSAPTGQDDLAVLTDELKRANDLLERTAGI